MNSESPDLLTSVAAWLQAERSVRSAVLFGSRARKVGSIASHDGLSDIDLHAVTDAKERIVDNDWSSTLQRHGFCMKLLRPASGGVSKLILVFDDGEVDIVLVPTVQMRLASVSLSLGLHRHFQFVAVFRWHFLEA